MLISYGPDENCTLQTCDVSTGVYKYRPSLAANTVFLVLFGISMVVHILQGFRWKTWAFLFAMFWGCVSEMIGYGGRIILWQNPFSFPGFLIQISECSSGLNTPCPSRRGGRTDAGKSVSRLAQLSTRPPSISLCLKCKSTTMCATFGDPQWLRSLL